jgi:hypothetical protein
MVSNALALNIPLEPKFNIVANLPNNQKMLCFLINLTHESNSNFIDKFDPTLFLRHPYTEFRHISLFNLDNFHSITALPPGPPPLKKDSEIKLKFFV